MSYGSMPGEPKALTSAHETTLQLKSGELAPQNWYCRVKRMKWRGGCTDMGQRRKKPALMIRWIFTDP